MNSRILTIAYQFTSPCCKNPVPIIRVQGRWLENLGFNIGDKILVIEKNGELIIKNIKEIY